MLTHYIQAIQFLGIAPGHKEDYSLRPDAATVLADHDHDLATASDAATAEEESKQLPEQPSVRRTGTLTSSTLLFISSCFGASILAVPWAMGQCGWALGLVVLVSCAALTQWGVTMLLRCVKEVAKTPGAAATYQQIAAKATPRLAVLPEILVFLNTFGCATAVIVAGADMTPRAFHFFGALTHSSSSVSPLLLSRTLWVTVLLALVGPICLVRDITKLGFSGAVSGLAVFYLIAVITAMYTLVSPESRPHDVTAVTMDPRAALTALLQAVPIFFCAFSVGFQVLPVHSALSSRKTTTTSSAVFLALCFTGGCYTMAGLLGYFTFGVAHLLPNVLQSYSNILMVDVARVLTIIAVVCLYPLLIFTARVSLMTMLGPRCGPPSRPFFILTAVLLLATYGIAASVQDISVVLGLVGALGTVPTTLTLPGLYLTRLRGDLSSKLEGWAAVIVGNLLMVLCAVGTLAGASD